MKRRLSREVESNPFNERSKRRQKVGALLSKLTTIDPRDEHQWVVSTAQDSSDESSTQTMRNLHTPDLVEDSLGRVISFENLFRERHAEAYGSPRYDEQ